MLLAKAVLVALFGADLLFPGRHGKSGLLFIFAAVVTSLICLFVEMLSACALISGDSTPLTRHFTLVAHGPCHAWLVLTEHPAAEECRSDLRKLGHSI